MRPPEQIRRAMIAKAQIAKKQLCLDDAAWRAKLTEVSARFRSVPVNSCADMTLDELRALLDELTRLGFQARPPRGKENDWFDLSRVPEGAQPHIRKAAASSFELIRIGAIRTSSPKKTITKFVKRITGVDDLRWLNAEQANNVIEAAKTWKRRFESQHPQPSPAPTPEAVKGGELTKAAAFSVIREVKALPDPAGACCLIRLEHAA